MKERSATRVKPPQVVSVPPAPKPVSDPSSTVPFPSNDGLVMMALAAATSAAAGAFVVPGSDGTMSVLPVVAGVPADVTATFRSARSPSTSTKHV